LDLKCDGCEEDKKLLQRMAGANKVRNWLIGLLVVGFFGGNYVARADDTQIALNTEAITRLVKLAEKNNEDHATMVIDRDLKQQEILDAIDRIGR